MRYLLAILFVLISVEANAFSTAIQAVLSAGGGAVASYCGGSCTPSGAVSCEGFGVATNCTWGDYTQTDTSITMSLTGQSIPAGLGCTDTGGYAAKIVKLNTDYGTFSKYVSWTGANSVYVQFYIYFDAITLSDGDSVPIARVREGTYHTNGAGRVSIKNVSGSYYFVFDGYAIDAYTTTNTVSADTWYGIRWTFTKNTSAAFAVDWNNDGTFTDEYTDASVADDATPDRFYLETVTIASAQTFTIYIANLKTATSGYPSDCTR